MRAKTINALIFLLVSLIQIVPAIYNGYPFVYSDTGTYLYSGFHNVVPNDRPIIYGLFLRHISLAESLWFPLIVQALMLSAVLHLWISYFFKRYRLLLLASINIVLAYFTSSAIVVSQIMPDIYSAIVVLATSYLFVNFKSIRKRDKIFIGILIAFSAMVHGSHLFILLAMALFAVVYSFLLSKDKFQKQATKLILGLVVFSWLAVPSIHYAFSGDFKIIKSNYIFITGRLIETGIMKHYLEEHCDQQDYVLCGRSDDFPNTASGFIWNSGIIQETHGWEDPDGEYKRLMWDILTSKYAFRFAAECAESSIRQVVQYDCGTGLSAYNQDSAPYGVIRDNLKREFSSYASSYQQKGYIELNDLNDRYKHVLILVCFILVVLVFTRGFGSKAIDQDFSLFFKLVIYGILANACVTASLANVYNRLNTRVLWILVFAMLVYLIRYRKVLFELAIKSVNSRA